MKKTSSLNNLITWVLFLCSSHVFIFSNLLLGTVDPEIWLMNEQHDNQLYKSVYPSIQRDRADYGFGGLRGSDVDIVVEVGSHPSSLRRGRKNEVCLGVEKVSRKIRYLGSMMDGHY